MGLLLERVNYVQHTRSVSGKGRSRHREARLSRLLSELDRIAGVLAGRSDVRRVVVFGSMARGDPSPESDLDLLIVQATEQRFLDRLDQMYRLLVPQVACDILVYTPEEFERLQKESPFVARVVREGRVLHAA